MPPITARFTINRPGLERDIVLQLNPECFSQRLMLDYFRSGQLLEPETSTLVDMLLQPGDTFIDIGGHVGFYAMLAAGLVGPTGRVYVDPNGEKLEGGTIRARLIEHDEADKLYG